MVQKFELSITSNYAHNWEVQDALRELIQNAIDQQVQVSGNDMDIKYIEEDETLVISNKKSVLEKKSLLLGYSSKQDDEDTIGQFGEGYKIAMLVLLREGKSVTIKNYGNREIWTSKLVKSRKYDGEKVLTVFVNTEAKWAKIPHNDLEIVVEGITPSEYSELVSRTLQLQNDLIRDYIPTSYGDILLDDEHKGMVFVNGLYVTDMPGFKYGYSIKPSELELGRDRNLVDSFDVEYTASKMWRECDRYDLLLPLIVEGSKEVGFLVPRYSDNEDLRELAEIAYKEFKTKYGANAIPVSDNDEIEKLRTILDSVNPVVVDAMYHRLLRLSEGYSELDTRIENMKNSDSPLAKYELWKTKYQDRLLTSRNIGELDAIIQELIGGNLNEEVDMLTARA